MIEYLPLDVCSRTMLHQETALANAFIHLHNEIARKPVLRWFMRKRGLYICTGCGTVA